jgi:F-type H+-transporting ATPase subunit epsilon
MHLTIVTPERAVLDAEVASASIPAHDGEIGFLPHRAPLLCKLGVGVLRCDGPQGSQRIAIDGGFGECAGNTLTILTEQAWTAEQVDAAAVRKELEEAQDITSSDEAGWVARREAVARGQAKLKLLQG